MIGLGLSLARSSRVASLAERDVAAYKRLIESKGGQFGDGIISEAEAVSRLTALVAMLYVALGRCDFWLLMEAYQRGFGSRCYSFHGLEGTLVNGPTWTREGIAGPTGYVRLDMPYLGGPQTSLFVGKVLSGTGSYFGDLSTGNTRGIRLRQSDYIWGNGESFSSAPLSALLYGQSKTIGVSHGSNILGIVNSSVTTIAESVTLPIEATNKISLLAGVNMGDPSQHLDGICSVYLRAPATFTREQLLNFHSAIKQTVGKDLDLP